ncbi:GNAT family N-acetyltransferase [Roseospira navarrensis]|uniref:GNAT family N-acetyltransferase n=1 Tax=Roseospira navarrensis TaxID=140058 RepID=A0A7X2D3C3_9PROT|nr:GNAT family N-acetyltransferase [Roseospira navarrensis]MQX36636.1 GNAT family N-acetyltransferase [Roseospira navarrensis]
MTDETLTIRRAESRDLDAIIRLLADDALGQARETVAPPLPEAYRAAFAAIDRDPHQHLVVAERDGVVVGTLQITLIPGLSHRGTWRGQIEAVRIARDLRGAGLGRRLMDWAVAHCRDQGCRLVQLTSDATRTDAHRFYESLGFRPTHVGFKQPM